MRLSDIDRNSLSPEQQKLLESIEQGPRQEGRHGAGLIGPFGAWIRSPVMGDAVQTLGLAIRFGGSLPENIKEVAICTVGAFYKSKFEFSAHKRLAINAGVDEKMLNQLRDGKTAAFEGDEFTAHTIATELLNNHGISDATYAAGVRAFGEPQLIELVSTVGYYCLVSLTLNAFQIPLEEGMEDPFPDG